jgi:hypothetical protein
VDALAFVEKFPPSEIAAKIAVSLGIGLSLASSENGRIRIWVLERLRSQVFWGAWQFYIRLPWR